MSMQIRQVLRSSGAQTVSAAELEEAAKRRNHHRSQTLLDVIHVSLCCMVWIAALCIISMGVVWVLHIVTPWGWLCPSQLDTIKNTLFSGAIGGLIADRLRKITP